MEVHFYPYPLLASALCLYTPGLPPWMVQLTIREITPVFPPEILLGTARYLKVYCVSLVSCASICRLEMSLGALHLLLSER